MLKIIKRSWSYVASAAIGILNFILLAIPYVTVYFRMGERESTESVSGYKVMDFWDLGFGGVMSSLIQLLVLITGILLFAYGVVGLLKEFGIFKELPDKLGKVDAKKLAEYGLALLAALNVLLLIFLIVTCAANSESEIFYGVEIAGGYRLSAGIFISIVLTACAALAPYVLNKKLPAVNGAEASEENEPEIAKDTADTE